MLFRWMTGISKIFRGLGCVVLEGKSRAKPAGTSIGGILPVKVPAGFARSVAMFNLKNLIANLPSAVIVFNAERRAVMANKMAQAMTGEREEALIGKRSGDIMGCVNVAQSTQGCGSTRRCRFCGLRCAIEKAFNETIDIAPFETCIETGAGGPLFIKLTVTLLAHLPWGHRHGDNAVAVVTVDDLTEFKKRERLAAALETIGSICHEINQPLTVLTGQLDLLEMDIGANSRLNALRDQTDRMGVITRKLQTVRKSATQPYLKEGLRILNVERPCA
jgi:hypothetical protein